MKHLILLFFLALPALAPAKDEVETLKPLTLTNQLSAKAYRGIFFTGQPTESQLKELRKQGFVAVVSLRETSENPGYDEPAVAKANGLEFIRVPVNGAKAMTPAKVDEITQAIVKVRPKGRVLVHCASGGRVGLWAGAHFKKDHGYSEADAMKIAKDVGMPGRFSEALKNLMNSSDTSEK